MNENEDLIWHIKKIKSNPINLHLGCGRNHFKDCINIDFPQEEQPLVKTGADFCLDIVKMDLPVGSVDSIQLHHVFEHFSRGVALGLLINWNMWLKVGGTLTITVPDAEACCRGIGSNSLSFLEKMKLIRHIAGSHEEDKWSFHIDQWFSERLQHTLENLNFSICGGHYYSRSNGVYDVDIIGAKVAWVGPIDLIQNAKELLRESTLDPVEQPMLDIWINKCLSTIRGF